MAGKAARLSRQPYIGFLVIIAASTTTTLDTSQIPITVNEKRNRFETTAGDETAYIDFQWHRDKLVLLYVYVPIPFRGKGYSKALIEYAMNYARERNVKVDVYCSFISRYMQLHPHIADGLR